jgi:hypothetical protein
MQLEYFPLEVRKPFKIICKWIVLGHLCGVWHFEDHFCEPLNESVTVVLNVILNVLFREMSAKLQNILVDVRRLKSEINNLWAGFDIVNIFVSQVLWRFYLNDVSLRQDYG